MPEKNSGKPIFILTFDLEEWFHILDVDFLSDSSKWEGLEVRIIDNTYKILDILYKNNIKSTFFVLGWVAKKYPALIKYISDQGHEIGSHSQNHLLIYNFNQKKFKEDIIQSIDVIQSIINKKVVIFRAPGFSITNESLWAFKVIGESGIIIDSSIFPATRGHGGIKNFGIGRPFLIKYGEYIIKEFPINMHKIGRFSIPFSGGGYFRIIPFSLFKYFANKSDYLMTYFHLRDFDPKQPIIKELPIIRKFKCYYGLGNSLKKFIKLINKYNFVNISSAAKIINWDKAPVVKLNG